MNILSRVYRHYRYLAFMKWDSIYKHFCFIPKIMSAEACVDFIICNHSSLARFGDGELACMFGTDLNFQKSSPDLQSALSRVSCSNDSQCLIGIPDAFENIERYVSVEQSFWMNHFYFYRSKWYSFLQKDRLYANTFLSRFYSMEYNRFLSQERIINLKRLWDERNVIFIEGKDTKLGVGNDLFSNANSIRRIIAPSRNAFDKYNEIFEAAKNVTIDNPLFFIALGPTATVLAYELSLLGFQALDMGHIDIEYEWYRMEAKSKVSVIGKFTNEAIYTGNAQSEVVGMIDDPVYEKQIIARIL